MKSNSGRVVRVLLRWNVVEVDSRKLRRYCSLHSSVALLLHETMIPLCDRERIDRRTLNRCSSEIREGKGSRKQSSRRENVGSVM